MPVNFEVPISLIAGALLFSAQSLYIYSVFRKKIIPSPLTWLGWSIMIGASFYAQMTGVGWHWNLIGIMLSATGCGLIAISSLLIGNYSLKKTDWIYLVAGLLCIILYFTFNSPWLTTIFTVIADLILAVPTISKALRYPETEKTPAWNLGFISWIFTLSICINHDLIYAVFPFYCLLFNAMMILLTFKRSNPGTESLNSIMNSGNKKPY